MSNGSPHFNPDEVTSPDLLGTTGEFEANIKHGISFSSSVTAVAATCRTIRSDLSELRAHIIAATSEHTKWILKMNRIVKKVVPALATSISTNAPMADEDLRWLHLGSDVSGGLRPASSSSSLRGGLPPPAAMSGTSPCPSSVVGSPAEAAIGNAHTTFEAAASHQTPLLRGGAEPPAPSSTSGIVSKRGSVFDAADPVLLSKNSLVSLRDGAGGGGGGGGGGSSAATRNIASADSSTSHYPHSASSAALPPLMLVATGHQQTIAGAEQVAPGAALTTTTGARTPQLPQATPSSASPKSTTGSPRGATFGKTGAQVPLPSSAITALEGHAQHHAEQHRRLQREREEPQRVQGSRLRSAGGIGVGPTTVATPPSSSRRTPAQVLQNFHGGRGPVLTMSCYGQTTTDSVSSSAIGPSSPLRIQPPHHPWTIGTSSRHSQLVEEAHLATALQLSTAQLRSVSPTKLEAMIAAAVQGHHHQALLNSAVVEHALRPISDAAIVGASLSALGLAGGHHHHHHHHQRTSPTRDTSVSVVGTDYGGTQTLTPFTSYYQQHHANSSAVNSALRPIGSSVLRSTGAAHDHHNHGVPSAAHLSSATSLVITAATSPPQPTLVVANSGPAFEAGIGGGGVVPSVPGPIPLRVPVSPRVKKGLVIATPEGISAFKSSGRTTNVASEVPVVGVRGGGMMQSNGGGSRPMTTMTTSTMVARATTQEVVVKKGGGGGGGGDVANRSGSAVGLTAWTPSAPPGPGSNAVTAR